MDFSKPQRPRVVPLIDQVYNHLVLPLQLPHREDPRLSDVEDAILARLIQSAKLAASLKASRTIRPAGRLDRSALIRELEALDKRMFLVVYVDCQNAALFIHRSHDTVLGPCVIFEAFEASAKNEDVLAADNAMQWSFPGSAVAVPYTTYIDTGFVQNLASFLENAAREAPKEFAAHTFKAGATVFEYRNTPEPALVTSLLMAILQENGRRITPTLLHKMVRDEVCWSKAEKPWRRLPYWLVLRVVVSRYLAAVHGGELGRLEYKFLLAHLFGDLLADAQRSSVSAERLDLLGKKICRRMAKLDVDKQSTTGLATTRMDYLFGQLESRISGQVHMASSFIQAAWSQQKLTTAKVIPALPRKASPDDLLMDLRLSGARLDSILQGASRPRWNNSGLKCSINVAEAAKKHANKAAEIHFNLFGLETKCNDCLCEKPADSSDANSVTATCTQASDLIKQLLPMAYSTYSGNGEQLSVMLLLVMRLWMKMDTSICALFPMVEDYHPLFHPEMLDVLLLPRYSDLQHLQQVQIYLQDRISGATSHMSMFEDPQKGCFGHQFYEQSAAAPALQSLHASIEAQATEWRDEKRKEFDEKRLLYDRLSRSIDRSTCLYVVDESQSYAYESVSQTKHHPDCPRCEMIDRLSMLKIQAYEHPLPADMIVAKTVVFELRCPAVLALYRDTTWHILSRLCLPRLEPTHPPRCFLKGYQQLSRFRQSANSSLSLASTTKSFLATHYAILHFPVEWEGGRDTVCRPNGLKLAYFDQQSEVWPARRHQRPTFLHHVKLDIPKSSPFRQLLKSSAFADFTYGPSSYDVVASATTCPSGVNVHEYLAFQTIASGTCRRWVALLTELGSVNLNFSNEATAVLLSHLTLQCGPTGGKHEVLRLAHAIFRDEAFCAQLLCQINNRLNSLATNWRENYLMDTVISLALRLMEFSCVAKLYGISSKTMSAIELARSICSTWFKALRKELYKSEDPAVAHRCQQYAIWAALLCKRTFTLHDNPAFQIDERSLKIYVESCITVQENLAQTFSTLPRLLQQAIVRDWRMSHRLRDKVADAILKYPRVLAAATEGLWSDGLEEGDAQPKEVSHAKAENPTWISCVVQSDTEAEPQFLLYNHVEGTLLINGHPVGKLPKDAASTVFLSELFGNQALVTVPSDRKGMQYRLCVGPCGFTVHVGYDEKNEMVVRAFRRLYTLQLIPRDAFFNQDQEDLPGPLINRHFHWLNLRTGEVYIAPFEKRWPDAPFFGYVLNIHHRTCAKRRGRFGTTENVVNPYSPLFIRAARILDPFEGRRYILMTQPENRHVQIRLQRLQLLFFVNSEKLLESPQLQCEIDPNQDAGTWYGLRSKLVCRNKSNPDERSILVPLGATHMEPRGCHVTVWNEQNGFYGKFQINTLLGRLDCTAEMTLIYTKALLHACTSFLLPDPLTGRTGTEEALQWLQSGICQPWSPLGPMALSKLERIAKLTPRRVFYPEDLQVMKTDYWTPDIPVTIQDSRFRPLVENILGTSKTLGEFTGAETEYPVLESWGSSRLHERMIYRQQTYERCLDDANQCPQPSPHFYRARHAVESNKPFSQVLEITSMIRKPLQKMNTIKNLAQSLSTIGSVGGFTEPYANASLSDRLKVDIVQNWGSLVRFSQECKDPFSLMFLLGIMSFNLDVDMDLLRTLVAFANFEDLRNIELPLWDEFVGYNPAQSFHAGLLLPILKRFEMEMPEHESKQFGQFASAKQRKKAQIERSKHEAKADEDTQYLTKFLMKQWPRLEPSLKDLDRPLLVDLEMAIQAVRPEWKRLFVNRDLSNHLQEVQTVLNKHSSVSVYEPPKFVASEEIHPTRMRGMDAVDLNQLLQGSVSVAPIKVPGQGQTDLALNRKPNMVNGNIFQFSGQTRGYIAQSNSEWTLATRTKENRPQHSAVSSTPFSFTPSARDAEDVEHAIRQLGQVINKLSRSRSVIKQHYANDLGLSLNAFCSSRATTSNAYPDQTSSAPMSGTWDGTVHLKFTAVKLSLETPTHSISSRRVEWLKRGNLWPVVTKSSVLARLSSTSSQKLFGSGIRELLIELGIAMTQAQRHARLATLSASQHMGRLREEKANTGHSNWNPREYPDWLLLEIECNIMIRPVQVDVALATICPGSGSNSVLQMNMGQGKTSTIIPMVAAALADRKRLVRVVVPKALLQQTAEILHSRLGRILNRPLRHLPFSRRTPTSHETIRTYLEVHKEMQRSAGIMLCQPEHNLSFMLSGLQRLVDEQVPQAMPMIKVQSWLSSVSRDILDESDYTLAVRTQLIYPSGSQMTVDGHPHRWQVAQAVLRLINGQMDELAHLFRYSVEVVRREGGGFPLIFFLRQDVEDELIRRVTHDICTGVGGILPMTTPNITRSQRVAIKEFISSSKPRVTTASTIRRLCPDQPSVRHTVYLLRGLLVNRILLMTLKKRWNVQYGLHPGRDPIAVPFHAKGVPSEQSEWGHPDVAILFTCLAFYYDGINHAQLRQCLEHVLKSDDPSAEYDRWTQSTEGFPSSLMACNSINVEDEMQLTEIWNAVRYNVIVIDYFLNNFVFPRHAKQFKVKLQSNGWDIPLFPLVDSPGESKTKRAKPLTTGFSGTNDNRTMLPLTIKQEDLPSLSHTSAEVLTYLLQDRNRQCILPLDLQTETVLGHLGQHRRATEIDLLRGINRRGIRILIDAGAQILEMSNSALAAQWLRIDSSALGALYFDEKNRAWVSMRSGFSVPLLASPFADTLDKCLVYLDEAHTRGTDLKLPPDARGALTLGLGQTKDHTVQAAMRLRQLGTTQSVTFVVSSEVHQSIADRQNKTVHQRIDSADVIEWLLHNTCEGIEQLQPLYYSQGVDFCRRMQANLDHAGLTNKSVREEYVAEIKQEEQQTLQQLYEPKTKTRAPVATSSTNPRLNAFYQELNARRKAFQDTGRAVHASALQEVEQEREVAFEVESVRQVKQPFKYPAHTFPGLHETLEVFARTGRLSAGEVHITAMFAVLARTGLGRKFKVSRHARQPRLFMSTEFERTVKVGTDATGDNFIRSVNWLLWSPVMEIAVVIIPEEAEALLPMMRNTKMQKMTHLLTYSAPTTRKMAHFNRLNFYSVPPLPNDWEAPAWLRLELGIFSGRLYFDWEDYEPLCELLGLEQGSAGDLGAEIGIDMDEEEGLQVDGAHEPDGIRSNPAITAHQAFVSKPLTFLQEWLALRRRGQDFVNSPMGFVAQGKLLQQDHAFFRKVDKTDQAKLVLAPTATQPRGAQQAQQMQEYVDYEGIDDMGANEAADSDAEEDEVEYESSEWDECEADEGSSE
ncbi:hypothetical protein S7711_05391 [Stachybotrys chartarum IBT 7711]|uniref:ubiquitinyl hydrolase 1 n=1 Tax=Stachybotrys chartarum (strain CBS 109288 / IBT 7711) TaxID=1280523 RepID=A0A084AHF8_STACB|nr:hypothetical protein S7711_05391 [Stachybotrys chartarum IBT 7711]